MIRATTIVIALASTCFAVEAASAQSTCPGKQLKVSTPPLSATPYVEVKLDGKRGPWSVDFGWTETAVSSSFWKRPAGGGPVSLSGLSFPHAPGGVRSYPVTLLTSTHSGVGQARGIIGTDLLKDVVTEFHFEDSGNPHVVVSKAACAAMPLYDEGFFRIRQTNFFSSNPGTHTSGLPNVPVVYIDLDRREPKDPNVPEAAGIRTWAQVDTGYNDTFWPYSVDVNEALFAQIAALKPAPVQVGTVPISGCGNEDSVRPVYVMPEWKLRIMDETGVRLARWFDGFYIIVKPKKTTCGGIGPMVQPAAQLGASFLRAFGTTIFMPSTQDLWIRTPQNPAPVDPL